MVKNASRNLSLLARNHRLALWVLLLLLTVVILLFPTHLEFEYHAIQSLYIFYNLPLFVILYCVWVSILLLLLFFASKDNEWQKLLLVCIFALVYKGFWVIATPNGAFADELSTLADIGYLQEAGRISSASLPIGYLEFPGIHFLGLSLSDICELGVLETRIWLSVFSSMLFAALLYVFFAKLLRNSNYASLGVLLALHGGAMFSTRGQQFWPGNLAFLLLALLLLLLVFLYGERKVGGPAAVGLFIVSCATLTISYLPTSVCFIFILSGIYLLQRFGKERSMSLTTIILCLVMVFVWLQYWSRSMFRGLVPLITIFIDNMTDGTIWGWLPAVRDQASIFVGEQVPLWASLTRLFWLAFVFIFGALLWIRNLIKARKLHSLEAIQIGGLLGVVIFSIVCVLGFPGGGQYYRFLMYAPFFTVPIILRSLWDFSSYTKSSSENIARFSENPGKGSLVLKLSPQKGLITFGSWFRKYAFMLLVALVCVLSLPTFLAHNGEVCTRAIYPYEYASGEFIESVYGGKLEQVEIFTEAYAAYPIGYYMREAHFHPTLLPWEITNGAESWPGILVGDFGNSSYPNAIFVLSERLAQWWSGPPLIDKTGPRWVNFVNRLSENNKIYDSGHIEIYERLAE
ncbi:hypothetical protein ACFLWO_02120 [Chloroflexota bacterium]